MHLRSTLPPEDLLRRIRSGCDEERFSLWSMSGHAGERTIIGKFDGDRFRLQMRRFYRNSFAPFFYGEVRAIDSGSELSGDFKLHPFVRIFFGIWMTGATLGAMAISVAGLTEGHAERVGPFIALPFALPLFGFGMLRFGRWLARNEAPSIVRFLERCAASEGTERIAVENGASSHGRPMFPEWLDVGARRLVATCWDSFWPAIPIFTWMFAHGLLQQSVAHTVTMTRSALPPAFGMWLSMVWVAYDVTFLSWRGQTLGKSWAGLRVEGEGDGGVPSFRQALERTAVKFLFFGPFVFASSHPGLLPVALLAGMIDAVPLVASERRVVLHDWIAGTRVVRASQ